MNLDVRKPVAFLFFVLGSLLAVFGALSPGTRAEVTPGFNVNLIWGLVLIIFGGVLTVFTLGKRKKS
jgi:hypothetical protein